jgi:transcriptional regulator
MGVGSIILPSTSMGRLKKDQLLGKLDLLVLRVLVCSESMHGYAIAERIELLSESVLQVGEGFLYPALHRMDEAGWIRSEWAPSDNNRRARYYKITTSGRHQLAPEEADWLMAGLACGLALGLATRNTVRSLSDTAVAGSPWMYAAVVLFFFAVTLAAAYVTVRRASRLDPSVALRRE